MGLLVYLCGVLYGDLNGIYMDFMGSRWDLMIFT